MHRFAAASPVAPRRRGLPRALVIASVLAAVLAFVAAFAVARHRTHRTHGATSPGAMTK
jgi:hypothetical protein